MVDEVDGEGKMFMRENISKVERLENFVILGMVSKWKLFYKILILI